MNSTCIHYEGSRPGYIHVHVLKKYAQNPLYNGETTKDTYTSNSPPQTQGGSMTLSLER